MESEPVAIDSKDYHWLVAPKWEQFLKTRLLDILERGEDVPDAKLVKRRTARCVFYLPPEMTGAEGLFLKRCNVRTTSEMLQYSMFPTKPAREWSNLREFSERGISVPVRAFYADPRSAFARKPSFLAIEEIPDCRYPNQVLEDEAEDRDAFINALALWVRSVLDAGIIHRDLQPGNVLVKTIPNGWEFHLIDLHAASLGRLSEAREEWTLAKLLGDLSKWLSADDRRMFIETCCRNSDVAELGEKIERAIAREKRRVIDNRTDRCLMDSTDFVIERTGEWKVYRRRRIEAAQLIKAAESAEEVTEITIKGEKVRVHVKALSDMTFGRNVRDFFQGTRGRRAWQAMHGFSVRGLRAPEALGLVEKYSGLLMRSSYLITRYIPDGVDLAGYVHRHFILPRFEKRKIDHDLKKFFVRTLTKSVSDAHRAGVHHRDMKGENLLITGTREDLKIYFLDLDSVRFGQPADAHRIEKNLMQLDASVPYCEGPNWRARFLIEYMRMMGLKEKKKDLAARIAEMSKERVKKWLDLYWRERRKAEVTS